jgi:hypothetical protein
LLYKPNEQKVRSNCLNKVLSILGSKGMVFAAAFLMALAIAGGHAFAQTPPPTNIGTVVPVTWTFDAFAANMASLLGLGLVGGIVFLYLTLRLGPGVVRAVKRVAGRG